MAGSSGHTWYLSPPPVINFSRVGALFCTENAKFVVCFRRKGGQKYILYTCWVGDEDDEMSYICIYPITFKQNVIFIFWFFHSMDSSYHSIQFLTSTIYLLHLPQDNVLCQSYKCTFAQRACAQVDSQFEWHRTQLSHKLLSLFRKLCRIFTTQKGKLFPRISLNISQLFFHSETFR